MKTELCDPGRIKKTLSAVVSGPPATTPPAGVVLCDYYRLGGAAAYLRISPRTLMRLTKSGAIACARLGSKLTLYKRSDLDAFYQRNRTKAVSEARQ